jgi:hypothetical protein
MMKESLVVANVNALQEHELMLGSLMPRKYLMSRKLLMLMLMTN